MVKQNFIFFIMATFILAGCHKPPTANSPSGVSCNTYDGSAISGSNVMTVKVGYQGVSAVCGQSGYINEPCTSVTICTTNGATCETINDILVDTGSYGLRIYRSALNAVPAVLAGLQAADDGSGHPIGECAQFGTANEWGQVETAQVKLGGESGVNIPIQVIDPSFASYSGTPCANPTPSTQPQFDGFNGILGVGLLKQDCGSFCETNSTSTNGMSNGMYYSCNGTTCTNITYALGKQVSNPVASLPTDNQGVLVEVPGVGSAGAVSTTGYLVLGIGSQSNNTPSGTTSYPADNTFATFTTDYGGQTDNSSFIDSGSNGLFFPSSLTVCSGQNAGFYCPSSPQTLSATNVGVNGTPSGTVSFTIASTDDLLSSNSEVFNNIGGSGSSGSFDWGLPFFMGCKVYVGLPQGSADPYWAY